MHSMKLRGRNLGLNRRDFLKISAVIVAVVVGLGGYLAVLDTAANPQASLPAPVESQAVTQIAGEPEPTVTLASESNTSPPLAQQTPESVLVREPEEASPAVEASASASAFVEAWLWARRSLDGTAVHVSP